MNTEADKNYMRNEMVRAVSSDDVERLALLLADKRKCRVGMFLNLAKDTILIHAARMGSPLCARFLIDNWHAKFAYAQGNKARKEPHYSFDYVNVHGESALTEASKFGHHEIAGWLISAGANQNAVDAHGIPATALAHRDGRDPNVGALDAGPPKRPQDAPGFRSPYRMVGKFGK